MGDFRQVELGRDLPGGGQSHANVGQRMGQILTYTFRDRCDWEYESSNLPELVTHGHTQRGKSYLITEFCSGKSLYKRPIFTSAGEGMHVILPNLRENCQSPSTSSRSDLKLGLHIHEWQTPLAGDTATRQNVVTAANTLSGFKFCGEPVDTGHLQASIGRSFPMSGG
jgi:hypothetical protein